MAFQKQHHHHQQQIQRRQQPQNKHQQLHQQQERWCLLKRQRNTTVLLFVVEYYVFIISVVVVVSISIPIKPPVIDAAAAFMLAQEQQQQQQYQQSIAKSLFLPKTSSSLLSSLSDVGTEQQPSPKILPSPPSSSAAAPLIIFPGGGIYFYWQAGFISYLQEQEQQQKQQEGSSSSRSSLILGDLSQCRFIGASAGALTATLTTYNCNFEQAMELAIELANQAGAFNKGLQGIWGSMIKSWLYELLQDYNDDDIIQQQQQIIQQHSSDGGTVSIPNRLGIYITPYPKIWQKEYCTNFQTKDELILCNMASVHLPYFLNNRWRARYRNRKYIDGSFLMNTPIDYIKHAKNLGSPYNDTMKQCEPQNDEQYRSLSPSSSILYLSHRMDPKYTKRTFGDFVRIANPDGIRRMYQDGYNFAKQYHEQNQLNSLLL